MANLMDRVRAGLAGRYSIEREIGSGGMAHVLLAQDLKHRRHVAIKVLRPDVVGSLGADRFLREIEFAARLSHPHVLPLHDSGETDGLLYYVMPFVQGESLRDRLRRERRLPLHDAVRIASEVGDALGYAHSQGVVHRDIKPENILLSAGHAVVSDFGIARAVSAAAQDRLTMTGVAIGTVYYMSPEQAVGDATIDGRSDIYSLGCVLYEMLAGEPPFVAATPHAVMARRFTEPAPTITELRRDVPVDVERAIARAIAKDPSERFSTAEQFVDTLEKAAATLELPAAERARAVTHLSRRNRTVIAGAAVASLAVAGWALWRNGSRLENPASVAESRIAVLPFTMHGGPQLGYMSEGIVDLLSRNLDGVADLRSVDPGTVLLAVRSEARNGRAIDPGTGRAIVRRVGAGWFILGSVNTAGSRMRVHAALHSARDNGDAVNASVEGDTTELLGLVDRLSAELLANRPGAVRRLTQTAALTTHSLPALKAFLSAEHNLRAGRIDSAIAGFQRAVAEDSTFALAYYRLAVAAGWYERHALSTEAVAKALATSSRLNDRDRRLVAAYAAFRRGGANEAERLYRDILEGSPDDVEAEFQLGDVLYQYNPLRGRPRAEARPMLDHVLAYDPGFL